MTQQDQALYDARLARHLDEMKWLYMELYDNPEKFDDLLANMRAFADARPGDLKERDTLREANPEWYKSNDLAGMMLYVDNFAGDLDGVREHLGYMRHAGVNLVHLMPFLDTVEGRSDGGYAVADFRKVREDLGTLDDLRELTKACHEVDVNVCMDFVMNHTSEDHEWARRARAGEREYMDRYFFHDTWDVPREFEKNLPEVFPTTAPGSFTYLEDAGRIVMTMFYPYQWDLNYGNPVVFNEMMYNFLFLANQGIDMLRLDAVPYIWKKMGTDCRNLPQVHTIVRLMRMIGEVVCPSVVMLGEVVMEPVKVVPYFGTVEKPECHLLYNVTTMCTTWHTVATRDTRLLRRQIDTLNALPKAYVFLNYLRCHDDIGWGLDYPWLATLGIDERAHKKYLNDYFQGLVPGSWARGELYNDDPESGDARLCGTAASLCGLEAAQEEDDLEAIDNAVRLDQTLHAMMLMQTGIPLIYSGDEVAQENDHSYREDPKKADDSRYLHRGRMRWDLAAKRRDLDTPSGQMFCGLTALLALRKTNPAFGADADAWTLDTGDDGVLALGRYAMGQKVIGVFNFTGEPKAVTLPHDPELFQDMLTGERARLEGLPVPPYGFRYMAADLPASNG